MTINQSDPQPGGAEEQAPAPPPTPLRSQALSLCALLAFVALAAGVYVLAGAAALSAVTTAGGGLFLTWRARQ
jgi:hypothetical protein